MAGRNTSDKRFTASRIPKLKSASSIVLSVLFSQSEDKVPIKYSDSYILSNF